MKAEIGVLKQNIINLETPGTEVFDVEIRVIFNDQVTRDTSLLTIKEEIETIYEDFTDIKEELTELQKLCSGKSTKKGFFSRKGKSNRSLDGLDGSLDKELLIVKGALYAALKNDDITKDDEIDVKKNIIDVMFKDPDKRQQILEMFNSEIGNVIFRGNIVLVREGVYKIRDPDRLFASLGVIKGIQGALASVFKLFPKLSKPRIGMPKLSKPRIPEFIKTIKTSIGSIKVGEIFTFGGYDFHLTEKIMTFIGDLKPDISFEDFQESLSDLRPNSETLKQNIQELIVYLSSLSASDSASLSASASASASTSEVINKLKTISEIISEDDNDSSPEKKLADMEASLFRDGLSDLLKSLEGLPDLPDLPGFGDKFNDLLSNLQNIQFSFTISENFKGSQSTGTASTGATGLQSTDATGTASKGATEKESTPTSDTENDGLVDKLDKLLGND